MIYKKILCNFFNHFSIFCILTILQVHAHRGVSCNTCKSKSAVFATASQLEEHKTSLCGKEFVCKTCKRQYRGLEHLQVRMKLTYRFYYFYLKNPDRKERILVIAEIFLKIVN